MRRSERGEGGRTVFLNENGSSSYPALATAHSSMAECI